jgi:hypothetical protein
VLGATGGCRTATATTPPLDSAVVATEVADVNYDEFKVAFLHALHDSRLPTIGPPPHEEVLDLRSTDRTLSVYVEPIDRDMARPFHVSAAISFRWDALQAARTATCEEDLVAELLGEEAREEATERPWLRVDIELRAGLEWGKGIPMPAPATWAKWSREALGRLENIERLVSDDVTRETTQGDFAVLAWQGDPVVKLVCGPGGELRLEEVRVHAFQGIDLPRKWNDGRELDEAPHDQLAAMFARVRAALHAWAEVTDHLRPR